MKKRFENPVWPLLGALAYILAALLCSYVGYQDLVARSAWTAATLMIPFAAFRVVLWGSFGATLGWALWALLAKRQSTLRTKAITLLLLTLSISAYTATNCYYSHRHSQRLVRIKKAKLTSESAQEIIQAYGNDQIDEMVALIANPTCPAAVLSQLASSPNKVISNYATQILDWRKKNH